LDDLHAALRGGPGDPRAAPVPDLHAAAAVLDRALDGLEPAREHRVAGGVLVPHGELEPVPEPEHDAAALVAPGLRVRVVDPEHPAHLLEREARPKVAIGARARGDGRPRGARAGGLRRAVNAGRGLARAAAGAVAAARAAGPGAAGAEPGALRGERRRAGE